MEVSGVAIGIVLSKIESALREKLKIDANPGGELFDFVAFSDDETFLHAVNVCILHPDWIIGDDIYKHEASYVVFYLSRYAPTLRDLIKKSDRLWDAVVEVLRLVDSGVPYEEAVKRADINKDLVEFVRRYGPIPIYENGILKTVLLLPSPAELKRYRVDEHVAAERIVTFILKKAELKEDQVSLPSGHVYRPMNPFEFYSNLLHASNLTVKDNVFRVLRSMLNRSFSEILNCDNDKCHGSATKVCADLGMQCDLEGTVEVKAMLTDDSNVKISAFISNGYMPLSGSVVAKSVVSQQTLVDAAKQLISMLLSHAATIKSWMKSAGAKQSDNEIKVGNLWIRLSFENAEFEKDGLVFSVPRKATIEYTVITKYVPDKLLAEALSRIGIKAKTRIERERIRVRTYVTGSIEAPINNIVEALNKALEVRNAVVEARRKYVEHVERRRRLFKSVEEAVAAYLNMVASPLFETVKGSSLVVEPGIVLTTMQKLIMQSGKHTATLMREMYENYWVNVLIASPQAVVVALMKDGVLTLSDGHVYVRGKDIEKLLGRFTSNPAEAEAKIRDFILTDVLIYAAEKKEYDVLGILKPYVTVDKLMAVSKYITPLIAIRLLDAGIGGQDVKEFLARKVLETGTPRQKTYVAYKFLRDALKGVPNIFLTKVDNEYVMEVGAFYVQIESLSKDSVTIIAYRKDTKIGFRFSGSTFREALRNAALNYDKYLERLKVKSSDALTVMEVPKADEEESNEKVSA